MRMDSEKIKNEKQLIRQAMKSKRDLLTKEQQYSYSDQITEWIQNCDAYVQMKKICIYQAFRNEVSCDTILRNALFDGKMVFTPMTDKENHTIEFYRITENTRWREGAYGIMEPDLDETVSALSELYPDEPALILMPGLAFDRAKHRIGYGGGYYDRYLAEHREHITAALCYDFQVINAVLPHEEHDYVPDYIITNREIII